MALIICPECKKKVSEIAEKCPHCGYKFYTGETAIIKKQSRKNRKFMWLFFLIIVIIVILTNAPGKQELTNPKLSKFQNDSIKHHNHVIKQFSSWSGEHYNSVKLIKKSMNDPESYDHVETKYTDLSKNGLKVFTKFRGKNLYGGVVTQTYVTFIDTLGNVTKINKLN